MKKIYTLVIITLLNMFFIFGVSAATLNPYESTSYSKAYKMSTYYSPLNGFGQKLLTYRFTPMWRINNSNSIYSCSEASSFINYIPGWQEVASQGLWYGQYNVGSRIAERYYGEGAAFGIGVGLNGSASVTGGNSIASATVSVSASATLGQTLITKYKASASTNGSWTSCTGYQYLFYAG